MLAKRAGGHPLVAHKSHVAEHRSLNHLKDHHNAFGDPYVLRVHIHELPRAVQAADVLLDHRRIENLACPRHQRWQFGNLGHLIAFDSHFDDAIGFLSRCGSFHRRKRLHTTACGICRKRA